MVRVSHKCERALLQCCSDGFASEDPDWKMVSGAARRYIHYKVRINCVWIDVPDDAVIAEPNWAGHDMVWTVTGTSA